MNDPPTLAGLRVCDGCGTWPCRCAQYEAEQDRLDHVTPAARERALQALHAYRAALRDLQTRRSA